MMPTLELLDRCRERVSDEHAIELLPRLTRALARYPLAPPLLYSIGVLSLRFGYVDLWEHYIRMALGFPHITYQDFVFRAEAKLRLGDWSGWDDREARLFSPHESTLWIPYARHIQWTTKAWRGDEDISDLTLLAVADGGFGDAFQMLRFIPALARAARTVILVVSEACLAFVQHAVGRVAIVISPQAVPVVTFHRYVWLMSLPSIVGALPSFTAFSAPDPAYPESQSRDHLQVGVCWAGNSNRPTRPDDPDRSMSLDDFAPILHCRDVQCYSLQVGPCALDAVRYPHLLQPITALRSFTETANLIASLDCVITVDTAIAHLSGSLGVPTYLLLPCVGDCRWGMHSTTPWYPSMQIIRQRTRSDWAGVVTQLMARLDLEIEHG